MNKSILSSKGFGISNGVSTILGLLAGFYATNTNKVSVLGALLSLLLTDPLSDSYSIYISIKDSDENEANKKFKETLFYQILVQAIFLVIVFCAPSIYIAFIISSIFGLSLLLYDYNNRLKNNEDIFIEIMKITGLIILTFTINTLFYKYYNL